MAAHGDRVCHVGRKLSWLARTKRDTRTERHFAKFAIEIARRTGCEVGLNAATRREMDGC
jgi:hypothetical protein